MKVNLSLVLDEKGEIRLDLIKNQDLEIVDQYTVTKENHNDIREDYKEITEQFLELNKNYTSTFKRESNKKGSIVITFSDETSKLRKLRVLYKKNSNKLDTDKLINKIFNTLKKLNDIDKTIEIINNYSNLMFNSDFEIKTILGNKRNLKNVRTIENIDVRNKKIKIINNNLLLLLKNKFINLNTGTDNQKSLCYYYLRLIDSYIEKHYKIYTTRDVVKTKKGRLEVDKNNVDILENNTILTSNIIFNGQILHEEEDGQLAMSDIFVENKKEKTRLKDIYEFNYDREDIEFYEKRWKIY